MQRMDAAGSDNSIRRVAAGVTVKRPPEDDGSSAKKRRKQLKPVRIATAPDSLPSHMVQVPKDDVVSCSEPASAVPNAKSVRCPLKDVPFQNDLLGDLPPTINVPTPDSGPNLPALAFPFAYHQQGLWSDRNLKIFNQEAYCELCKKEFCNKYFLKTHKANKHGIYNNDSIASSNGRSQNEPSGSIVVQLENGNKSGDLEMEDKMKVFCNLCNKSFCNKYFVRRHKTKSHGYDDIEGEPYSVQNNSTNLTRSTLIRSVSPKIELFCEDDEEEEEEEGKDEPLNLIVTAESETSSEDKPEECTENLEKLQTMLLRLHPTDVDPDQQVDDNSQQEAQVLRNNSDLPMVCLGRKQSKPTSSYCEICNKELCNKYFMRTHMQRMHGIELEHGTQIGGVVCNICNKELCSKYFLRVHKQNTHGVPGPTGLPTLRTDPKMPPRPTSFSQVCLICSKRFRSSKWLQAHLQSDHRDDPNIQIEDEACNSATTDAPLNVISKLFWETNSLSNVFSCSQCAFTTPVLAFLFVHERSHFLTAEDNMEAVKPSLALQDLIHHKTFWQHAITQQPTEGLDLTAHASHVAES